MVFGPQIRRYAGNWLKSLHILQLKVLLNCLFVWPNDFCRRPHKSVVVECTLKKSTNVHKYFTSINQTKWEFIKLRMRIIYFRLNFGLRLAFVCGAIFWLKWKHREAELFFFRFWARTIALHFPLMYCITHIQCS